MKGRIVKEEKVYECPKCGTSHIEGEFLQYARVTKKLSFDSGKPEPVSINEYIELHQDEPDYNCVSCGNDFYNFVYEATVYKVEFVGDNPKRIAQCMEFVADSGVADNMNFDIIKNFIGLYKDDELVGTISYQIRQDYYAMVRYFFYKKEISDELAKKLLDYLAEYLKKSVVQTLFAATSCDEVKETLIKLGMSESGAHELETRFGFGTNYLRRNL